MQTKRTIDGAPTPQAPDSTLITLPAAARRATALRASDRRATAREPKDDVEGRIFEYLKDRPKSTADEIAKGEGTN
jgi:hypothetical protein